MDLDPTDEQKMLADAVGGLLDKRYDANMRLALLDSEDGWSRDMWQQYAELGLLGLTFDEQYGGAGMGVGELAVVMERSAARWCSSRTCATVVLGAALVAAAGSPEQKADVLPRVADGSTAAGVRAHRAGVALVADRHRRRPPSRGGDGWTADAAQKIAVAGGDAADRLVVSARTPDGAVGLFLVDAADARAPRPLPDAGRPARGRRAARRRTRRARSATPPTRCTPSSRCSTSRPPRCAPRRSARWSGCSG